MSSSLYGDSALFDELTTHRRHLHRHPELSHKEFDTADYVETQLRALPAVEVFRPAPTSICAVVRGQSRETFALRADLDALPIDERTEASYRSCRPGAMHACGHDGHTAVLLGLARRLSRRILAGELPRSILLIFQQAEESANSGAQLVLQGIQGRAEFSSVFGFHLWPELPTGSLGLRSGPMMAGVDGVTLEIETAKSDFCHGTRAGEGQIDAISVAVRLYQGLSHLRGHRKLSEKSPALLHIGKIQGGAAPQSLATTARLVGTLRSLTRSLRDCAILQIEECAASVSQETGAAIKTIVKKDIRPPLYNDLGHTRIVEKAGKHLGADIRRYPESPLGVSEDFGWYLDYAKGAFFLLGCSRPGSDVDLLHSPHFDFDERALVLGVQVLEQICCKL